MNKLKRICGIWLIAVLLSFGGRVQAANVQALDSQAADIIAKASEVMNNVKVVGIDTIVDGQKIMGIYADQNTGIVSISMSDGSIENVVWIDQKSGMTYTYDGYKQKYYFEPYNSDDLKTDNGDNTGFDPTLTYSYSGEEMYGEKKCYKVLALQSGVPITYTYYIEQDTYRVAAVVMEQAGEKFIMNYSYPDAVVIPDEAKKNAILADGYVFIENKIGYQTKYVKGKPVLYVVSSENIKGSVKIPDTIKICGKDYKVYGVVANAFQGNKKIMSVTLGKNIHTIGKQAFYKCEKLKTVKISSKELTKIGAKAFYGNAKTLKFKVPNKKVSTYKKMLEKSKLSSKLTISKM